MDSLNDKTSDENISPNISPHYSLNQNLWRVLRLCIEAITRFKKQSVLNVPITRVDTTYIVNNDVSIRQKKYPPKSCNIVTKSLEMSPKREKGINSNALLVSNRQVSLTLSEILGINYY